jgi:DNA-binding LytR/AlgR family response regulator
MIKIMEDTYMEYNVAICDDEIIQVNLVEKLIMEAIEEKNTRLSIYKFLSGEDLIKHCYSNKEFLNIIFLDMEMSGIDGIKSAKKIREKWNKTIIIFITGYKEYVFDVFEVYTFRYLLKPVKKDEFNKALFDAIKLIEDNKTTVEEEFLIINKNKEEIIISYKTINYFEKYRNKILVNTDNKDIEYYGTFNELNIKLNMNKFIKLHQGFIVNIDKIELITAKEAILKNGQKIPVSRRNIKEVKETFFNRMRV